MQPVLLLGVERKVRDEIVGVLQQNGGAAVCEFENGTISGAPDARFCLLVSEKAGRFALPGMPVILGRHPRRIALPCRCGICLLDSSHPRALQLAMRLQLPAVTCGFRAADGLTCSSLDGGEALLCLQRGFCSCRGEPIEPFERPVSGIFSEEQAAAQLLALGILLWYS